jgi:hypothetical protein
MSLIIPAGALLRLSISTAASMNHVRVAVVLPVRRMPQLTTTPRPQQGWHWRGINNNMLTTNSINIVINTTTIIIITTTITENRRKHRDRRPRRACPVPLLGMTAVGGRVRTRHCRWLFQTLCTFSMPPF